ncbi:MAG: hypothetical protein HY870_01320 [Chloroflexi bacterium]|nr:hypothetical protein [Chloroflexota bacterium]
MFETNELSGYLAPNERVVWQGQGKRRMNSASGWFVLAIFAAAMVGLVTVFVTSLSVPGRSRGDLSPAVIFPLILLVVILSVGIPLMAMSSRSRNGRYFVTNQSAVIVYPSAAWSGQRVTIIALKNVSQITLSENRDGTGTLTFGQSLMAGYGRYGNSWMLDSTPSFSNIEQPRDVYQLIRKQMAEA